MIWGRSDRIAREAAEWVVLVDSSSFDAGAAARFKIWLEKSPSHRAAFQLANRAWTDLDQLEKLNAYPEIVALLASPAGGAAAPVDKVAHDRRALILGAGAAVAMVGVAGYALLAPGSAEAFETGIGERRDVALADGTRIVLNAGTRISVRLGAERRQARLIAGEALFIVAASEVGPLVIATPDGEIEATSGEILVKQLPDGVRVALLSNGARASARGAFAHGAPVDVAAQSEIVFGHGPVEVEEAPREELARRTLWRNGRLAFDDTPLSEASADVSRQTGARFAFTDPALADLRIGGLIEARDLDGFLALLRQNLRVSAHRREDGVIELRPIGAP